MYARMADEEHLLSPPTQHDCRSGFDRLERVQHAALEDLAELARFHHL